MVEAEAEVEEEVVVEEALVVSVAHSLVDSEESQQEQESGVYPNPKPRPRTPLRTIQDGEHQLPILPSSLDPEPTHLSHQARLECSSVDSLTPPQRTTCTKPSPRTPSSMLTS